MLVVVCVMGVILMAVLLWAALDHRPRDAIDVVAQELTRVHLHSAELDQRAALAKTELHRAVENKWRELTDELDDEQ